ncbi:ABC transporter permease [Amylibacter sp.]|jgi:NitT/TauT family transport system permease protein|nr:ABC nitrate/sulfonate/bicarbonate transporter, inner membrane subunit [Rhodobacterales bacterium HTCC2255]MBT3953003.1 ABC transporter permease [Rhodobacterales bacterium]MCO4797248.1 ABC transporter permease [Amylibacter sp.]MBT4134201.1 ABC transporter permease [Rhodobacterales bacterium]MBT4323565.1 ABC transporter permease [Rhodobacterales bacterium]|tara:strand:- start:2085 stop:2969 length:885 start_codon:yes stop_codon:yes gene_type:complete
MNKIRDFWNLVGPIFTILLIITAIWYASAVWLNSAWAYDKAKRANVSISFSEMVSDTMIQEKPLLPSPHQVIKEIYKTTVLKKVTSKRSLIWHGWITLSATLLGFAFGTALGIILAVGIVFSKSMDMSVMPWVITSQTIPILAIAPMIIVVLNAVGVSGLLPKAIISMYLSFFPVVVGMVKGLRSPDQMQLDQMRTWSAPKTTSFWKLRLPSSMPYLFASLKIGVAASLVGAIVGELPTGAVAGLGARLLAGSYYGQTIQIWSALICAAILAASLVAIIGVIERITLRKMGIQI